MREEPIRLVAYDPDWPRQFEEERVRPAGTLGRWLVGPIEHIGSTAVPDLVAKPIIDIMAGVRDLPSSLDARDALAAARYEFDREAYTDAKGDFVRSILGRARSRMESS
ncbi:MAG TPA: GrpB family protein [Gemmatimonadaceae bacterium]|nr:GrpB family protein [Gemmatimonadaceae bacterium]